MGVCLHRYFAHNAFKTSRWFQFVLALFCPSTEAKFTLKFGAAGFNERNLLIERAGCLQFVNDLE